MQLEVHDFNSYDRRIVCTFVVGSNNVIRLVFRSNQGVMSEAPNEKRRPHPERSMWR